MPLEPAYRRHLAAAALMLVAMLLPGAASAQAAWPDPMAVARAFAGRYPQTPAISYIPTLSWRGALRLAELAGDTVLRERVRTEMQVLLEGPPPADGESHRLTSLAGYAAAADLGRIERDPEVTARARGLPSS